MITLTKECGEKVRWFHNISQRGEACDLLESKPRKEIRVLSTGEIAITEVDSDLLHATITTTCFNRLLLDSMLVKKTTINGIRRFRLADYV